ncbi:MAG: hypothetical protein QOC96_588 [Acidobacteriota bacterium]|jgi:hypothetical protein|nr:hypothetical protein [Acidobacteriota bacterium]
MLIFIRCLTKYLWQFPGGQPKSFFEYLSLFTHTRSLAFLWSDEGNDRLKRMVDNDHDLGVRQSALWAYGFAVGEGARNLLVDKSRNDPNNRVREFASQALEADDESWWKM